jgi:prophage regulatory protein
MALDRILRLPEVTRLTGMSRSTIYSWCTDPNSDFPKQLKLGPKSVGWRAAEIADWLESRRASA